MLVKSIEILPAGAVSEVVLYLSWPSGLAERLSVVPAALVEVVVAAALEVVSDAVVAGVVAGLEVADEVPEEEPPEELPQPARMSIRPSAAAVMAALPIRIVFVADALVGLMGCSSRVGFSGS
jgi:hypothetical protein